MEDKYVLEKSLVTWLHVLLWNSSVITTWKANISGHCLRSVGALSW